MSGQPYTPERLLKEVRLAKYISQLTLGATTPRFRVILAENPEFAADVRYVVVEKIALIRNNKIYFMDPSARNRTLRGWENFLTVIDKSLGQVGSPSL